MPAESRKRKILGYIQKEESPTVKQLVDFLEVSPATVRRDLVGLDNEGNIVRLHGAVMDRRNLGGEPSFLTKRGRVPKVKRRIGQVVAEQIPLGATVFVDAGTTCLEAGMALLARGSHTIYTNSLPLLTHGGNADSKVIGIGGEVRELSRALVGSMALDWIRHLKFDYSVVGASALDLAKGVMTTELNDAGVKRSLLETSAVAILAADSGKLESAATVRFADWSCFQIWVTDRPKRPGSLNKLKNQKGLRICQVEKP